MHSRDRKAIPLLTGVRFASDRLLERLERRQLLSASILDKATSTLSSPVAATALPSSATQSTTTTPIASVTAPAAAIPAATSKTAAATLAAPVATTPAPKKTVATKKLAAYVPPTLPTIPAGTFNILNYGASTSSTNNATAIQAAITAATSSAAKGGTVEIPAGTFLSGPITLSASINLQLDSGALLEPLAYGTYPGGTQAASYTNFITAKKVSNVEISGSGTIDGQGSAWWTAYDADKTMGRPQLINIDDCKDTEVTGITIQNAPMDHIDFTEQNNEATVTNVTINSPGNSPNTVGVQVEGSNFYVYDCTISDGDDNVVLNASSNAIIPAEDSNVSVDHITCYSGHGISIGSETTGGVDNVDFTNCVLDNTTGVASDYQDGIRLKSDRGAGGLVENVTYDNIAMTNVQEPILIYSYYDSLPSSPALDYYHTPTSTTPIWENILLENITASGSFTQNAGIIWGLPEEPVQNITLENTVITAPTGLEVYHVRQVRLGVQINVTKGADVIVYDTRNFHTTVPFSTYGAQTSPAPVGIAPNPEAAPPIAETIKLVRTASLLA
jgi:polygalacturonase